MNNVDLILSQNEKFKFITVIFEPNAKQSYTYKTNLDVAVDDLVVVPANQNNTFKVVQVKSILDLADVDFDGKIKWVASKLDLTNYDGCKAAELNVIRHIRQKQLEEQRTKLVGDTDVAKIARL